MNRRPWYQFALFLVGGLLVGVFALGGLFDSLGNAIALCTPIVTYFGTAIFIGAWLFVELFIRYKKPLWYFGNGQSGNITRIGWWQRSIFVGIIVLLWIPRLPFMPNPAKVENFGDLEPSGKTFWSSKEKIFPLVQVGQSATFFELYGDIQQPLFTFLADAILEIKAQRGQLKISAKCRDENGSLIAELVDNEWKVNPGKRFDLNYSNNALEVKDDKGDIVLQVVLYSEKVQLQIKTYSKEGQPFGLLFSKRANGAVMIAHKEGMQEEFIEPLFKYPADLHLGEFR